MNGEIGEKDVSSSPSKSKGKRNHFTIEKRVGVMKHVRRYLVSGLTYEEMRAELLKENPPVKISLGGLFKFVLAAKEDLLSNQEASRLIMERVAKKRYLEEQAVLMWKGAEKDRSATRSDKVAALRLVKEVQREQEDFISRFNLLPAIPVRQEFDVRPKVNLTELVDILIKEEAQPVPPAEKPQSPGEN